MTTSILRTVTAAAVLMAALAGSAAWAGLVGAVTAITPREITLGTAAYPIDDGTRIEDTGGRTIGLHEIRPGTAVELEFDEEGRLAIIRATVVR